VRASGGHSGAEMIELLSLLVAVYGSSLGANLQ
jgi:hypothetical protein